MEATIRPSRPEDRDLIAPLVYMAASSNLKQSIYDVMFGTTKEGTLEYLKKLFLAENASWFHWTHCFVAEVDGRVASSACGYAERDAGIRVFAEALKEVTDWKERDFDRFAERIDVLHKVKPPVADDVWIVEHVATYPEYRHRGLVRSLFDRIFARGRTKGFKRAQITFAIGNEAAQHVYESEGFCPLQDCTDNAFEVQFGSPGLRIFTRDL